MPSMGLNCKVTSMSRVSSCVRLNLSLRQGKACLEQDQLGQSEMNTFNVVHRSQRDM